MRILRTATTTMRPMSSSATTVPLSINQSLNHPCPPFACFCVSPLQILPQLIPGSSSAFAELADLALRRHSLDSRQSRRSSMSAVVPSLPLSDSQPRVQRFVHPPPVPPESCVQLFGKSFVSYVHATHITLGRSKETIGAEIKQTPTPSATAAAASSPSAPPSLAADSSSVHISLGNDHTISRQHIHLTWNPLASAPATAAESLERALAAASSPAAAAASSSSTDPSGAWELTVAGKNGYWFDGVKFAMAGPIREGAAAGGSSAAGSPAAPCPPHVLCQREGSLIRIGAAEDESTMFWILPAQIADSGSAVTGQATAAAASASGGEVKAKVKKRKIASEGGPSAPSTSTGPPAGDAAASSVKKKKKRTSTAADAAALPPAPDAFTVGSDDLPLTAFIPQRNPMP